MSDIEECRRESREGEDESEEGGTESREDLGQESVDGEDGEEEGGRESGDGEDDSAEVGPESGDGEDDSTEVEPESGEDMLSTPESQEVKTPTDPDSFVFRAGPGSAGLSWSWYCCCKLALELQAGPPALPPLLCSRGD